MRVLVNALSTTNLSGRHVLMGHLSRLAPWTVGEHSYVILHHRGNATLRHDLGANVEWVECPASTSRWPGRAAWERLLLPRRAKETRADLVVHMSGATVPGVALSQLSYAMNPWALTPGVEKTRLERLKAALQRRAYRHAMATASMMVFLSEHLRGAYRRDAGFVERASEVVYPGLHDETHAEAERIRASMRRVPHQVLSVSAMARHKDVATLVRALALVRRDHGLPARLILAGPWPDSGYEREIRALGAELGLGGAMTLTGHVSREELHRLYGESRVFALMSRCESFGIPAVEAQAFGTPVVSSNCSAIPEACGRGGLFPEPGDVEATAAALARLLTDDGLWAETSEAAIKNAARYRWEVCSRRLLEALESAARVNVPQLQESRGAALS